MSRMSPSEATEVQAPSIRYDISKAGYVDKGFNGSPWPLLDSTLNLVMVEVAWGRTCPSVLVFAKSDRESQTAGLFLWKSQPEWLYQILADAVPKLSEMRRKALAEQRQRKLLEVTWGKASL